MTSRDRAAVYLLVPIMLGFLLWIVRGTFLLYWINGAGLASHGVPITGVVTWTGGRSQIRYSWSVAGQTYEAQDGTGHPEYSVGEPIALRYLPESPSVAHFDWGKLKWRGEIGFPISLVMWLVGCVLVATKFRRDYS